MKNLFSTHRVVAATAMAFLFVASFSVRAATINWTNSASGGWNTAANWNPNGVPGTNDTAIITNAGVTVSLNGATTVGAIILGTNGAGTVTLALAGQTLGLNGQLTVNPSGSFTVDSGILVGNTNAVLRGTIGWSGAAVGGVLTLASGSTLNITTGSSHDMSGCVLTNYGTVAWTNGAIRGGGGIYNYGLWDAQSDQTLNNAFQNFTFNNYGTFRKSGGTNTSQTTITSGVLFNLPSGVLDVQQGNLVLQGSGNFTGGYITTNTTGTTYFSQGNFSLNGTPTGTNVIENGGNLVGPIVVNGFLTWVAGNWNLASSVTIPATSKLLVVGPGSLDMSGCIITNNGTVVWASGTLRGGGGIYNYGLWDAQSDQTLINAFQNFTFNNYGTFRKSGGLNAGQTLISSGVLFNLPSGVLDVQQGNLVLQGSGNFTGGYITTNTTGTTYFSQGNFSLNGTPTGTNVIENGGNLVGPIVVNGFLTWVAGNWDLASSVTIPATSKLLVVGPGSLDMSGCIITNNGTVVWASGTLRGGGGIYNYGLWDAQSDQTLINAFQNFTFNNYGTFRKSGGLNAGQTLISSGVLFNLPSGVLDVQQGNLVLQGSGNFTGGYITTNTTGTTYFSQGNFSLNGTPTGTNVIENGGNLVGPIVVNGFLTWVAGNWDLASSVTIPATSKLLVVGPGSLDMSGCIITNNGTVVWASGTLRGGGGIYNYGLWDAQSDQTLINAFQNFTFNNFGTFRKSGGLNAGQTLITGGVLFNLPSGVLDVQQGNLVLQGSGTFTGGYITTNSTGTTVFAQGNFSLNGTLTGTNVIENAGNLVGTNVINGALKWMAGNWNGTVVTILPNSIVNVAGGAGSMDMSGCVVTNYGTVAWTSGTLRGGGGIYNYGLWDAQSDQIMNNAFQNYAFNNFGTFRKSGTAGGSSQLQNGVTFNNPGTLDLQTGIVSLLGNYSLTNGALSTSLNSLTNFGRLSLGSSAALTGTLTANLKNGFIPTIGDKFQVVSSTGLSGTFSSVSVPAGISVTYSNNGVFLFVLGTVPVQILYPQLIGTNFSFQFATASGQSYTIQRNDDLNTTNWVFYTNIVGDGSVIQFQVPVTATPSKRFFRIREP